MVWFKKDLRIFDNPALYHALEKCEDGVIGIYFIDFDMWNKCFTSQNQIQFILSGLHDLKNSLTRLNVSLIIKTIQTTSSIPKVLLSIAEKYHIENLFFNNELEIYETERDLAVTQEFQKHHIKVEQFNEQLILPAEEVRTGQDDYFKVFTPFKRQWLKVFQQKAVSVFKPKKQTDIIPISETFPSLPEIKPLCDMSLWPSGENAAEKKLNHFLNTHLFSYDKTRDYPHLDATSKLSPYLATGMISAKTCFLAVLTANSYELDTGNPGALTFLSELIWREFYRQILIAEPRIGRNKAYKMETENLPWNYDENLLNRWQEGKTGFPLVDAAMRQLNTIGWMHNRLRMVTAMFLSKNLFLDWRLGEKYFATRLIDLDFASNNGGWQWSASTGTDAVPYFRMFNPITQSEKFDPTGDFIREYCPELKAFDNKSIHNPYKYQPLLAKQSGYPSFIIDYAASRERTIRAFKKL